MELRVAVRPVLAVTVSALVLGLAPARSASAQAADPPSQTVTAIGTGEVRPDPSDRNDNDAVRRAVAAARRAALPLAVASARARAVQLGSVAGLRIEGVLSVSETPPDPHSGFYNSGSGTFGPNRFCGQVPRFRTERLPGRVIRRRRTGSRRMCRVPARVAVSLTITYRAAPAG